MKKVINLPGSLSTAPYSPAVQLGDLLFVSGQVGFDPIKREYYGKDIISQTKGALENLKQVLEIAGSSLEKVGKVNIFLSDVADFEMVNEIYQEYFIFEPPARSCVQIAAIPKGALIEIEAVAFV